MGCDPREGLLAAARSLEAVQAVGAWRQAPCGSRPQIICVMTGRRARALAWLGGSCDRLLGVRVALDGGERVVAELAQDVVRAPAELARNREAGPVVIDPLGNLQVVGVVGRAGAGGPTAPPRTTPNATTPAPRARGGRARVSRRTGRR